MRLQEWLGAGGLEVADFRPSDGQSQIVFDEIMSTGAVITGRRTGDFADYWGGDHHDGVPIFVPTHTAPADNRHERVHFVTEGIAACVEQARAAAGDRDVMLHGAITAQECLKAGLLDVLEIQLMLSCSVRAGVCSRASRPNTSSSTWSERWRHPAYYISAMRYVTRDGSGSTCPFLSTASSPDHTTVKWGPAVEFGRGLGVASFPTLPSRQPPNDEF